MKWEMQKSMSHYVAGGLHIDLLDSLDVILIEIGKPVLP